MGFKPSALSLLFSISLTSACLDSTDSHGGEASAALLNEDMRIAIEEGSEGSMNPDGMMPSPDQTRAVDMGAFEPDLALDAAGLKDASSGPIDGGSAIVDDTLPPVVDADATGPEEQVCPPVNEDCDGIEPHDRNSASRYPMVFVHGMGGFENLGPWDYYYGIPELLRENGYTAHITVTDPFNTSEVRTAQLRPQIDRILNCTCRPKINLIAHSQGGIDSRLLISRDGYGDRVASLTTISTPHRGTQAADALLGLTDGPANALINGFMAAFTGVIWGAPEEEPNLREAMVSCSRPAMAEFNESYPNDERVAYFSFAGFSGATADGRPECEGSELPIPRRGDVMAPEFLASFLYLGGPRTANDGLVRVSSAKWGRFRGCLPADHLDQIGQLGGLVDTFDYRRFYLQHAEFLANEGF